MMKKLLFVSLLTLIIPLSIQAQGWIDTLAKIDGVINKYYQSLAPGGQLSISRNGQTIYSRSWGLADLERQVPMSHHSKIEAGSVSKQFTAAAILLLEQQGKLSLNDDIRKYVPELKFYGDTIRIDHLMRHSSGLRDWGSIAALTGWPRSSKFYRNEDALEIIARQKRLNNRPGDEFIYSNSGYNLMAIIVKRVSGISLAAFCRKFIFEPAGMTNTEWRDDPTRVVPDRALAYSLSGTSFSIDMPNEYVYGNGGLLTTTEDLLKWSTFYSGGKLGTTSLYAKQTSPALFNNGLVNNYGAGLFLQPIQGWKSVNHGGATAGYRAYLVYYPDLDLTVAMLFNTPKDFSTAANALLSVFAPDKTSTISRKNIELQSEVDQYTGIYRNDKDGSAIELTQKDKKLLADKIATHQVSANEFSWGTSRLVMNGKDGFLNIAANHDTVHYSRVGPPIPAASFIEYQGQYFSEETNSTLTVKAVDGALMITLKPEETHTAFPAYKDGFRIPEVGGSMYFTRSKKKSQVTSLWISVSRARNVEFVKLASQTN
jgi:CubicO group peptidase (beta-lactamase class C family)